MKTNPCLRYSGLNLKRNSGFTLIELLITVAIVAILITVALPSYQDSIRKGKRIDGQKALLDAAQREERNFAQNGTYTTDLVALGVPAVNNYTLSVVAPTVGCPIVSCYVLQAAANGDQANDTITGFRFDSTGLKQKQVGGVWVADWED